MKSVILILWLFLPTGVIAQLRQDNLDTALEVYINNNPVNGMAVAIITSDSLLYAKGFGYADRENGIPYTVHTFHPIASITKTLVGFSLMKAQELGKLHLDDDINQYLPFKIVNPHYPNEMIRIRHLATHSSGLKDRRFNEKGFLYSAKIPPLHKELPFGAKRMLVRSYLKQYNSNVQMPVEEFLKNPYNPEGAWYSKKNFAKKKPGELEEYSNNGAALAALIIEKATGVDFQTFVRQHILDPLKMKQSGWSITDYAAEERTAFYLLSHHVPDYESITLGDGGFISSIDEFTRYMMEVMRGHNGKGSLLQASSYQEMLSCQLSPAFGSGIFWGVGSKSIGHTGGDVGVSTLAYFNKEGSKGMMIFMNTSDFEIPGKQLLEVLEIMKSNSKSVK